MKTPITETPEQKEKTDFSLVLGDPLYQLYLRTQLLRPPAELLLRRILAVALLTCLPLVPLTALNGHFSGGVAVPFLSDLDALACFLISLPLLILAEPLVHSRVRIAVKEFLGRDLITAENQPKFQASMALAERLRNLVIAEVLLIVIAIGGYWLWRNVANEMRLTPFNKELLLFVAFLIALPLLPLILTMIPLDVVLCRVIEVIL